MKTIQLSYDFSMKDFYLNPNFSDEKNPYDFPSFYVDLNGAVLRGDVSSHEIEIMFSQVKDTIIMISNDVVGYILDTHEDTVTLERIY